MITVRCFYFSAFLACLLFSSNGHTESSDVKKITLGHQFGKKSTKTAKPKNAKQPTSPVKQSTTTTVQTKSQYFNSLGHQYRNPNFRQSQQRKSKKASVNRQLAQEYLSTLGHSFIGKSLKGKRVNELPTAEQDDSSSGFLENEELLLIAQVEEHVLDTVFGYKQGNGAMIDLDNLFSVIDFPIIVDLDKRRADGWFINENQKFSLIVPDDETTLARVTIDGSSYQIPRHLISVKDDDIYLHSAFLSDIFDIGFEVNFKDLLLLISPKQLLPLQERFRRRARLGKLSIGKLQPPQLPFRNTPYTAFSLPLVDIQTQYSVSKDNSSGSYSMVGMGDLAYMTGSYFLGGNDDDPFKNFRLNLQKESIDNDLLGPIGASEVALGDISPVNLPLLRGAAQEAGFKLSNRNLTTNSQSNTTDFVGDLLPGWDIELYHNGILLETRTVDDSGRYEFRDLDLSFGDNVFKMVFYGPQGQKRERIENVQVNANTLQSRKLTYNLSVSKQNDSLFNGEIAELPLIDSYRTALSLEQSLSNDISLQSGYTSYQFRDGVRHSFVPFTVNYYFPFAKINLGVVKDLDAGSSVEFSSKSRFSKHSFDLNYKKLDEDFTTDSHLANNVKNSMGMRLSGPLYNTEGLAFTYSLNGGTSTTYNDVKTQAINAYLGMFTNEYSLSNTLSYTDISILNSPNIEVFNGNSQFTKNFDSMRWRTQIGYDIKPDVELTNASTSLFWSMSESLSSEFGLHYNKAATRASYILNWDTDYAVVSANVSVDDNSQYQAFLSLRFSFGQDPTTGNIKIARDRMATTGGISARVFEDLNLDGIYNNNEPLIEGAKLVGIHARRDTHTKESGVAFLTGLPKNRITDVKLDVDSLDNPFWIPVDKGFSFLPRPGAIESLDIPVVTAGEIEGVVTVIRSGKELPGRFITLQILDDENKVVQETDSEYDGFYLFSAVIPGKYKVVIAPAYLKQNNLMVNETHQATIFGDGTVVRGIDFTLNTDEFAQATVQEKALLVNGQQVRLNLGKFASAINKRLTLGLLKRRFKELKTLPIMESTDNQLILGPTTLTPATKRLCQRIVTKGLSCEITPFSNNQ